MGNTVIIQRYVYWWCHSLLSQRCHLLEKSNQGVWPTVCKPLAMYCMLRLKRWARTIFNLSRWQKQCVWKLYQSVAGCFKVSTLLKSPVDWWSCAFLHPIYWEFPHFSVEKPHLTSVYRDAVAGFHHIAPLPFFNSQAISRALGSRGLELYRFGAEKLNGWSKRAVGYFFCRFITIYLLSMFMWSVLGCSSRIQLELDMHPRT